MIPALSPIQPGEILQGRYIDFKKHLLDGETVESATVTSSVPGMVLPDSVQFSGTVVTWAAVGTVDGDKTVFTAIATGSLGSVREGEVSMKVKAI